MRTVIAVFFGLTLLGPVIVLSTPQATNAQDAERQYVIGISGMT